LSTPSSSSARQVAPVGADAVAKTTGDVSWSLATMQAYQTLGCQTPGAAAGFGSTPFYGQSSSPYSTLPAAGSYADGPSRFDVFENLFEQLYFITK